MEKIFHVFVSSTYSDLIDERKKVSEAVAKAGFVAEGMEIFPASSQKQMDFIERVIDRCDYYILIVAGRYGSVSEDGLSYTEKEFRYAKSKGIPVLAFLRGKVDELPKAKTESDAENQLKLDKLVTDLKSNALVDFWLNPDELSTKALAALAQARISHEGVGWIRADQAAGLDVLNEVNDLRKENSALKKEVAENRRPAIFDDIPLAGLDEGYEFKYKRKWGGNRQSSGVVSLTWREILAAVGASYRTASNTSGLSSGLQRAIIRKCDLGNHVSISVDMEDKERILMQMEALGLMTAGTYNLKGGGSAIFHKLTNEGVARMLRENVVKTSVE
ncbi:DUF4062 domain-containing protein [Roseinatronobacter monicus]|uniref:Uncharacterized protein DUF4062 n=1 Tax=Roseinatronobacter monicus TaxID=393481 RepID=A0A543K4B7_9RHOB|nr:DUF4062 domain-containing protein [Roseinatronobacter monicus]TQM89912.1 uncharacterized protein DUF4062 [Roseinatronobacter monicus]